ncbi:MAG: GGDEF domain-containing protein [Patescibacteria group bacterium]|nr:GGDEF domain-containing protein [Patescibacteria group bacterium]
MKNKDHLSQISFLKKRIKFLEKIVYLDELIKIYNRRGFLDLTFKILKELQIDEKLNKRKFKFKNHALVIFDIDNFKKINDLFGHSAGDKILKIVSKIIKNNIRSCDILGRWGGEELISLLIDTNKNLAFKIVDKIRKKIKNKKINITISGGISDFSKYKNFKKVFNLADKALYKVKKTGKNKIIIN